MTCDDLYKVLTEKIKLYHPRMRLDWVEEAYRFGAHAHSEQFRKSGEPYFIHPLWVAVILAELQLDTETIVAGLLHDVVEDTQYTKEDISDRFGEEVALLVEGVTKLQKFKYSSKTDEQAENYRKLFFATSKDIRIILIKIADRLHNMRTLEFQKPEKQREIAKETLDIYSPLAHRLGISRIRYELEDLSFKYWKNDEYKDLAQKIGLKQAERQGMTDEIVRNIQEELKAYPHFNATVEGRPKHFFSIYKKMITKHKKLDEIHDLFAVRVLVDEFDEEALPDGDELNKRKLKEKERKKGKYCYEVMGLLHSAYTPVPRRVKDFIAMPKPNRYQSLHTTLLHPDGRPFEVQIRTYAMHRVSELGVAAHWRYKSGKTGKTDRENEEDKMLWLGQILEWHRELADNEEYIDAVKFDLSVFNKSIYCFSPRGDVIALSSGATVIDFAYAIHSSVGNHMVGARVNDAIVPFEHVIDNGDRVEILTSQNTKGPSMDWVKIVKTGRARNKINQWFKQQNRNDNILRGRELMEESAKTQGVTLAELLADGRVDIITQRYSFQDYDSLCAAVGHGDLKENYIINRLIGEYEKTRPLAVEDMVAQMLKSSRNEAANNYRSKSGIIIQGIGDTNVRFSKCCSPLPGDEVVGFVTRGRGVSIHRTDCINIIHLDEIERKRVMEAEWKLPKETPSGFSYHADLRIHGRDRENLLYDITRILSEQGLKLTSFNGRINNGDAVIDVGIEITKREQYEHLYSKLLKISGIREIERVTT